MGAQGHWIRSLTFFFRISLVWSERVTGRCPLPFSLPHPFSGKMSARSGTLLGRKEKNGRTVECTCYWKNSWIWLFDLRWDMTFSIFLLCPSCPSCDSIQAGWDLIIIIISTLWLFSSRLELPLWYDLKLIAVQFRWFYLTQLNHQTTSSFLLADFSTISEQTEGSRTILL